MSKQNEKSVVLQFNECINHRDLQGLSDLMSEDHVFIDSDNRIHRGKELMIHAWRDFFDRYPDYQNHFEFVESRENQVVVVGRSTCSFKTLDGPALWSANVENGRVTEWRVFADTDDNRRELKLEDRGNR